MVGNIIIQYSDKKFWIEQSIDKWITSNMILSIYSKKQPFESNGPSKNNWNIRLINKILRAVYKYFDFKPKSSYKQSIHILLKR